MNKLERETIILNAVCHLIDDMLNRTMVVEEWSPDWSNIVFRTNAHEMSTSNPKELARLMSEGYRVVDQAGG
ncbi:MAG: hypothetical protein OXE84_04430 [Rhodobacteraceae bacterium]|nr:hypothetical protein [Paracoccaceae bacterium]MCY4195688.1 hypothetical protein [Paracoccaceae bacterium]MCY4326989.1 hypothetical protein [Paracoccaceae bacterium]